MKKEICVSCEEKIEEDYMNYTSDCEPLCEGCYSDDLNTPKATILGSAGKYYICHYNSMDEYGDYDLPDHIQEYSNKMKYTRTDGWRGYNEGEAPKGYKSLKNTWFCGFDGHNMDDLMTNLNEIVGKDDEYLSGFDYFIAFLTTSNVFSTGFELYIKDKQAEEFVEHINNW